MTAGIAAALAAGVALSLANGANDNFKGVATLFGAGVLRYWPALALATVSTFAGSLAALAAGAALVASFSGKGLVPDAIVADPAFMTAVGVAAAATVLLASWRGLPISTTHALLGALVGVGLVRAGGSVDVSRLSAAFALPLLASPLCAAALAGAQGGERDDAFPPGEHHWRSPPAYSHASAKASSRLPAPAWRR
jgi:PiT family inorganic phosphate transporter